MLHTDQIKSALGIRGVISGVYSWRSAYSHPGAQIDLLIDRDDDVINLCEMKFTTTPWEMQSSDYEDILRKQEVFRQETGTTKAIHTVLVSAAGVKPNQYAEVIQNVVTLDDLFSER